jgi:hypothetical protein
VEDVRLEARRIAGRWLMEPRLYYGNPTETPLAQKFANADGSDSSILRFTKMYGPLDGPQSCGDGKGGFIFATETWRANQREFWLHWRAVMAQGQHKSWHFGYLPPPGNSFYFRRGWIDLECGDLWTFMTLQLHVQPAKLRICQRPDCGKYFFANHGKERYCSTDCANWSQARLKKRWHEKQRSRRKIK